MDFTDNVRKFLDSNGFAVSPSGRNGLRVLDMCPGSGKPVRIIPVPVRHGTFEEAGRFRAAAESCLDNAIADGARPVIVAEDLWMSRPEMMQPRLLAQLGRFVSVFARNTAVRRIVKAEAAGFLDRWHTYGYASCRYRYGLFAKDGRMVAVSCFSAPRNWDKNGHIIRPFEWVRYASLPDTRVVGGMGKMLEAFIREVHPDDVMSYADREWTDGKVYETLGFAREGGRSPVRFNVDADTWKRVPSKLSDGQDIPGGTVFRHINLGSIKYRLKLTDYE